MHIYIYRNPVQETVAASVGSTFVQVSSLVEHEQESSNYIKLKTENTVRQDPKAIHSKSVF